MVFKFIPISLFVFSSFSLFSQTAKDYLESGIEKQKQNNHQGAISDFNKAIEIDNMNVNPYFLMQRALLRFQVHPIVCQFYAPLVLLILYHVECTAQQANAGAILWEYRER